MKKILSEIIRHNRLLHIGFLLIAVQIILSVFLFYAIPTERPQYSKAASSTVTINEVSAEMNVVDSEFVELYNSSSSVINISDWKLQKYNEATMEWDNLSTLPSDTTISALDTYLLTTTDYSTIYDPDGNYTMTAGLDLTGESIRIVNSTNIVIDKFAWGTGTQFETAAETDSLVSGKSLGRTTAGNDSDNNDAEFALEDTPTPNKGLMGTNTFLAYVDTTNSVYGEFVIVDNGGNVVVNETVFNAAETEQVAVSTFANNNTLVAFRDNGSKAAGKYMIYDQSGSVVLGETTFNTGSTQNISSILLENNNVMIVYTDGAAPRPGYIKIINQSGGEVLGATQFNSELTSNIKTSLLSNGNVAILFHDYPDYPDQTEHANFIIYDQSGGLVLSKTEFDQGQNIYSGTGLNNGNLMIAYPGTVADAPVGLINIFDQAGDMVGADIVFDNGNMQFETLVKLANNNIIIAYSDASDGSKGKFVIYDQIGNEIVAPTVFSTIPSVYLSVKALGENVLIAFTDPDNDLGYSTIYNQAGELVIPLSIFNTGSSYDMDSSSFPDVSDPTIFRTGESSIDIYEGVTYTDLGATATDDIDRILDDSIVTVNPVETSTPGTYTITYNVDDSEGNSATEVTRTVNVLALEDGQQVLQENTAVTSESYSVIVGSDSSVDAVISIPEDVTTGNLNISSMTTATDTTTSATILASLTINSTTSIGRVDLSMPSSIEITADSPIWDGIISTPVILENYTAEATADEGNTAIVTAVIEVGAGDTALTFNKAVRLLLPDQAGRYVGYSRSSNFTKITEECSEDTQAVGNALSAGAECKITVGDDIVIWTKHFTKFLTYSQTADSVAGGGVPLWLLELINANNKAKQDTAREILENPQDPLIVQEDETITGDESNTELIMKEIVDLTKETTARIVSKLQDLLQSIGREEDSNVELVGESIVDKTKSLKDSSAGVRNFISYGTSTTQHLGAGERAGVVDSFSLAYDKLPVTDEEWKDIILLANGRWPDNTNADREVHAEGLFKQIYLRDANRENPYDDAAIIMISYGLRPLTRSIESENIAIKSFNNIFGHLPKTADDWNAIRAIAYSGAER